MWVAFANAKATHNFIPRHTIVAGYYGFTLVVRESVRPSYVRPSVQFSFPDDNLSKHQWIFTKLGMFIYILWRSALGLLMGKFRQFFTELSARDDYLSKHQWIFTNLVCALILWRSGLGLLMSNFRQFLTELSNRDTPIFSFPDYNLSI